MGATHTSKEATLILKNSRNSLPGLCDGIVIKNPFRPLKVQPHPRQSEMDSFRSYPSKYK